MKAHIKTLDELFEPQVQFVAPTHQRRYAWKQEKQWEPLWKDLLEVTERLLACPDGPVIPHFLGPIVIAPGVVDELGIQHHDVIDGQQRLTTMQILIHVVVQEERYNQSWSDAGELESLVRNTTDDPNGSSSFKVLPNRADRISYYKALSLGVLDEPAPADHPILQAWHFFHHALHHWLQSKGDAQDREHHIWALGQALRTGMRLAVVELSSDDDPHRVFETMNARGEGLTAYDLVKNQILHAAAEEGLDQELLYDTYLDWSDEDAWSLSVGSGAEKWPLIDQFLYDWLLLRSDNEVRRANIYREYREHTDDLEGSVQELVHDLREYADIFSKLASEDGHIRTAHSDFFQWLHLKAPAYAFSPALMSLFRATRDRTLKDEDLKNVLRVLEVFMVRRAVCGLVTTGYRHLGRKFARSLGDNPSGTTPVELLIDLLVETASQGWVMPTDHELTVRVKSDTIDEPNRKWIVWLLKCMLDRQSGAVRRDDNEKLFGVRIIPKGCSEELWPRPADLTDEFWTGAGTFAEKRSRILSMLGNYTLAYRNLNREMPEQNWTRRSLELRDSGVVLVPSDRELFDQSGIDDNHILRRTEAMGKLICDIWPYPSGSSDS